MPIVVGRLFVFFNQYTVNGNVAVVIRCGTARACAGNAVIIFLADDSGFKGALNLNVELIRITFAVICNERSLTVRIHDEFQLQIFIAFCDNRDDVAALNGSFAFIGRIALLRDGDRIFVGVFIICAAACRCIGLAVPGNAVHLKVRDVAYIAFRLCNLNVPIASVRVAFQRNVFDVDGLSRRLGRGNDGGVLGFVQGECQRLVACRFDHAGCGIARKAFADIQSAAVAYIVRIVFENAVRAAALLPCRAVDLDIRTACSHSSPSAKVSWKS